MKRLFTIQLLLLLLLYSLTSFGFTLEVTTVNESCLGNGSLTFAVADADSNGSILYVIYKLPNLTTPYASGSDTIVNGLTAGDYRIMAKETVGNTTTTQQEDITITSSFIPLSYTVQALSQACATTSTISVIINSGTAASYAIILGPITYPQQSFNTFSGLPAGVYKIRVIDSCGNSVVQTFTVTLNLTNLTISNPVFTNTNPPSCTQVIATNTISASTGTVIGYPLQIHYVLHLPGGVNNINTNVFSGNATSQNISLIIPYTNNQPYTYDITLTDACGTTYPTKTFLVNNDIVLVSSIVNLECNHYAFTLTPINYLGTYSLQFISNPAGFTPAAFNSSYPGPYNQTVVDFGDTSHPVPFGDYTVRITDSCGKTAIAQFSIIDQPPVPSIEGTNNGCLTNSRKIVASITSYEIITAIITAAPASYPFALPHDVTASVNTDGILILDPIPLGTYTIKITDNCSDSINPLTVIVPAYTTQGITTEVLQGCDFGRASIKITGNNSPLTSVKITAAPVGFLSPLPLDISNNIISSGILYMAGLVAGNYTFNALDSCGFNSTESVSINGYAITTSAFSLVANCGSFDIPLHFVDNTGGDETFNLQKLLDVAAGTWGNPATNAVYTEGTTADATNSYLLANNTTNLNLTFNGTFRIIHQFTSYNNGSDFNNNITAISKTCIEILSPSLTFNNALSINDVYRVPCSASGNLDVFLSASGAAPLHYHITEKDGISFVVDNGTSNIFLNISSGIYKFEVEDSCGNTINRTFDVSDLASLVALYPVCDLFSCAATINGNETFDLSTQSAVLLGDQSPSEYTLSYFTSQANATSNNNPITNLTAYNPTTNPATIYTRLVFNQLPNCYQTGSFDLITGQIPKINLQPEYLVCDSQPITLNASAGNLPSTTYSWSNGLNTPTVTVGEIGTNTLTVTATNNYGICNSMAFTCTVSNEITVTIADLPEIRDIETHDWTDNENSITVITSHDGAFEYSLDGINFQSEPTFPNLRPGLYTVYVRDINGCKTVAQEIWLLNYPKFFTPNGDGYNETWYIKNSEHEPDFKLYIFDRYGKLITEIEPNTPGWDGKLNGKLLFADDYWFAAYRQDGRVLRGHFTLKR